MERLNIIITLKDAFCYLFLFFVDHVGSYHPVFFDGWSPEYPVIDDLDDEFSLPIHSNSNVTQHTSGSERRHGDVGSQYTTEFEYDPKYHPPSSPGPQEFSTTRSEISVESTVIESPHHMGSPASLVGGHNTKLWLEDLKDRGARVVQATHPRTANNDKELTVLRGEYLEVRINNYIYQITNKIASY